MDQDYAARRSHLEMEYGTLLKRQSNRPKQVQHELESLRYTNAELTQQTRDLEVQVAELQARLISARYCHRYNKDLSKCR